MILKPVMLYAVPKRAIAKAIMIEKGESSSLNPLNAANSRAVDKPRIILNLSPLPRPVPAFFC